MTPIAKQIGKAAKRGRRRRKSVRCYRNPTRFQRRAKALAPLQMKPRRIFLAAGNRVPAGSHVDHRIDLQLGGGDILENMAAVDASVNTSLGSAQ